MLFIKTTLYHQDNMTLLLPGLKRRQALVADLARTVGAFSAAQPAVAVAVAAAPVADAANSRVAAATSQHTRSSLNKYLKLIYTRIQENLLVNIQILEA